MTEELELLELTEDEELELEELMTEELADELLPPVSVAPPPPQPLRTKTHNEQASPMILMRITPSQTGMGRIKFSLCVHDN